MIRLILIAAMAFVCLANGGTLPEPDKNSCAYWIEMLETIARWEEVKIACEQDGDWETAQDMKEKIRWIQKSLGSEKG